MASKIQSHNFYVAITPYKVQGVEDQYNELSVYTDYNQYTHQFYVSLHAGWKTTYGHGAMIMGDSNPLTASTRVNVKESPKNSQKTINEIGAALELAKTDIAWLFDERMWPELRQFVKDVALYGYTYDMEQRIKGYKGATEREQAQTKFNSNSEDKTMTKNLKAADLIGKVIIVGNNQGTITVKSVQDNGMLACEFKKTGDANATPMTVTMPNLQKMQERGLWKVTDDVGSMTAEVGGQSADIKPQTSNVTTEADVAEVNDVMPKVTPSRPPQGEAKAEVDEGTTDEKPAAIVKPMETKPKAELKPKAKTQTSAVSPQTSKYVYATYQTSKGKTGAKITGVSETDAAYQQAAAIHASASYERDKDGNKQFYLCFGPRYAEAAKQVCEALNAGKSIEYAIAIIDKATEERAVKREEGRRKREEYKAAIKREQNGTRSSSAEREQARPKVKAQTSAVSTQKSKCYSDKDVAEMLRKVLAGGDVPEDIKAILDKAA